MLSSKKIVLLSAIAALFFANQARPAGAEAPERISKPDERVKKALLEIGKLEKEWAGLSSLDRVAAIMAVTPVNVSTYPHRENRHAVRGRFTGETVAMSVRGDITDVGAFLESIEAGRSPLIVESARVRYISPDLTRADIRIFAARKVQLPSMPEDADDRIKEMFLDQLDGLLEQASKLKSGQGVPFRFFEEAYKRWPLGFPDLEEISFEDGVFTVYPERPLSRPEPLVVELARRLSEAAKPARVNLAPLVGPLVRSREIELSAGGDGFTASWKGLKIVELREHEIISYLVGDRHIFVIFKSPLSAKTEPQANAADNFAGCISRLRAYDIESGSRRWELEFPGCDVPFTNMVMDSRDRLLLGRGHLLSAIEPDTGKIIKRWSLSVGAKDLTLPAKDTVAVYGLTSHNMGMRDYVKDDARSAPLLMHSAPRAAGELHGIALTRLTDSVPSAIQEKKPDHEIIRENLAKAAERIKRLAALDETNPWYPFFRGMIETLNESESAGEYFRKALNMPLENPFHYLEMGNKLERLELYGVADEFYEKAFVEFLKWYRPSETGSLFTGFIYFVTPANRAIEDGRPERVPALMKWLNKFQPLAQKTDLIELEMAARYSRDGKSEESARAMERYRRAASEGFGISLSRLIKAAAVRIMTWVVLAVFIIFTLVMVLKYRKARASVMAEAGWPDLASRLTAITEPPGNFFRFNTLTFLTQAEKLAMFLVWLTLLALSSLTIINGQIRDKNDDFLLLGDYNSPRFADRVRDKLKAGESPENLFLLGLVRHLDGEPEMAKSHYNAAVISNPDGKASARALNNLGVLYYETGKGGEDASSGEFFKKACGNDPWLPEALYNMGIVRNDEAYKRRAVTYGLEKEYREHYPDRPVRAGPDARMIARLLTGYRLDMLRDLASNWGRIITGDIARGSGSGLVAGAHSLLLLVGLVLIAIVIMPSRHVDGLNQQEEKRRWFHILPGPGAMMKGRPLFGVIISAVFLFSLVVLCCRAVSGVALISDPSAIKFPLEFPDLSSGSILRHEPIIKGATLLAPVALLAGIACHSAWLLVTWRKT